jgi:8-oxo-dGTP pyrophosphatase MutT (NUDIX family)
LHRELAEELGVVPTAWVLHSKHDTGDFHLHLFVVREWHGRPHALGDEHSEIRWHDLSSACRLPDLAAPKPFAR